ncbi:hypothetical protein CLF_110847 [Clonorchis sinensis]|uniref:Uncharacterized protein n=1 Tax=Clonorchis sinensis TaxID=79923 RepID=G7YTY9_CLOSI|nr:hypothetical protein CLF_110847 [Clonorchis sinensis]
MSVTLALTGATLVAVIILICNGCSTLLKDLIKSLLVVGFVEFTSTSISFEQSSFCRGPVLLCIPRIFQNFPSVVLANSCFYSPRPGEFELVPNVFIQYINIYLFARTCRNYQFPVKRFLYPAAHSSRITVVGPSEESFSVLLTVNQVLKLTLRATGFCVQTNDTTRALQKGLSTEETHNYYPDDDDYHESGTGNHNYRNYTQRLDQDD